MANNNFFSEGEKKAFKAVIEDLHFLFNKEEILSEEINDVLNALKSEEAKLYISHLASGSKPEPALREAFAAGKLSFMRYLFRSFSPEVRVGDGSVDYIVRDELGRGIALEIKPLFTVKVEQDRVGRYRVKKIVQEKLNPNAHKDQILKYIRSGEAEYVILTNLREWFFFNRKAEFRFEPFFQAELDTFVQEYDVVGDLREYLERKESESVRHGLDEEFFSSLRIWIDKLSEVRFTVDDKRKLELIIQLINKLIFIQTLDDHGVVEFNWIRKQWNDSVQKWLPKGKLKVLEEFLEEVDEWFFAYYDTELFRERILDYIDKSDDNVEKFYNNLQLVIGLAPWQGTLSVEGILQYNFRYVDEDIFGKAYEMFLAEARKEEGIYYTPKYITQYIAENTVGKIFDSYLVEIEKKLESRDLDGAKEALLRLASIKVLDPACGSGSFLIKALRIIVNRYRRLRDLIEDHVKRYSSNIGSLDKLLENKEKLQKLSEMREIVGRSERDLISRVIVRHIHGVDLDGRALEVAKVNIWLEAIKLAPREFRYDRLPQNTNHILPNLKMNLRDGDSLINLPEDLVISYIKNRHRADLETLSKLRSEYLIDPTKPEFVDEIEKIKSRIRSGIDDVFRNYIKAKGIPDRIFSLTKPLYWALEYWFVFFDEHGEPLEDSKKGFDVIIGNPPYLEYRTMASRYGKEYTEFLKSEYTLAQGQFDITIPFTEKALKLLKKGGVLSYIMTNKFMVTEYGYKLRKCLLTQQQLVEIVDVSNMRVFKDVSTYPVIFTVIRRDADLEYNIRIASPSEKEIISGSFRFSEIPKSIFTREIPLYIITPYITGERLSIFHKTRKGSRIPEDAIKCGVAETGFSRHIVPCGSRSTGYIEFVQGEDIVPYFVIPSNKCFPMSLLSVNKQRDFGQKKIMIPGMVKNIYCGYDTVGYGCGRVYYITESESPYPLSYLAALFNSSLFKFVYRLVYGMSHLSGDYLRVNEPYLQIFRIAEIDTETRKKLEDLVTTIILLKKARYTLYRSWVEWSERLKKGQEPTLYDILSSDLRLLRVGEFDKVWTSRVSFYPDQNPQEVLDRSFYEFKITGDVKRNLIAIYGIDENGGEEKIYEIDFTDRELMLHVYLSLLRTLESRIRVESLRQLLNKTKIPIIRGTNIETKDLTLNILRKAKEVFGEWIKKEGIANVDPDIAKLDNEIEDLEAMIDAMVFKLYKLDENEIKAIFDFLKTPIGYRDKVIKFYKDFHV